MDRHVVTAVESNSMTSPDENQMTERNLRMMQQTEYYRDGFRNLMRIVNIQAVIIFLLVTAFGFYVGTQENRDRYFAETLLGAKMQMAGLPLPNMGKTALSNWASQAATQIMTFGFNDIDQRFALSQKNFTSKGWQSFHKAMLESGLAESVISKQQIITSAPLEPPTLSKEGLMNGVYSWVFEMPLLITVRSGGVSRSEKKTVYMVIESVPTQDNPSAVGIGEWKLR